MLNNKTDEIGKIKLNEETTGTVYFSTGNHDTSGYSPVLRSSSVIIIGKAGQTKPTDTLPTEFGSMFYVMSDTKYYCNNRFDEMTLKKGLYIVQSYRTTNVDDEHGYPYYGCSMTLMRLL